MEAVKVKDLIAFLQGFDPELPVSYRLFSSEALLELKDITLSNACPARPDGWVQNDRPDAALVTYLRFPGN